MSAGVVPVRVAPRCGCCDRPNGVVRCDRCDEPTCDDHLRRVVRGDGSKAYHCILCVEAEQIPVALVSAPLFEVPA